MSSEDSDLQDLVNDFVTESREHLASVETDLLSLEAANDDDTVNRVFRAVHSVKGVAGFLGFETINRLAHTLESTLDLVRKHRLEMSGELVTVLLDACDKLGSLIEDVGNSNTADIVGYLDRLQVFQNGGGGGKTAQPAPQAPPPVVELLPGERLLELELDLSQLALVFGAELAQVPELLGSHGRVVTGATQLVTLCTAENAPREPFKIGFATLQTGAELQVVLGLEAKAIRELHAPTTPIGETAVAAPAATLAEEPAPMPETIATHEPAPHAEAAPLVESAAHGGDHASPAQGATPAGQGKREHAPAADSHNDSICVSVHLLDRLMNLSGELVLGRNQLMQAQGTANEKGIAAAATRLNQVVSEMQEAIMQTRMQPVGSLFQRFPRVLRDLSGKLGKRCRLEIEGKDVELDRSILESLSDPLTHLVRNAIDHGMETPPQRRTAGKAEEGLVQLVAAQQGGNVRIVIVDDGRGMDPQKLRRKAVEKGVITQAQADAMSDREAIHLIFAPGFSTAEKVTDVSGRGVGMDVVRSNIEKLGGHVEVSSKLGKGSTIQITIPLTLAILPAMVIACGERRYVLAQANVAELVRIRGDEVRERIANLEGREVFRLRGRVLPVLRLREVLGEPKPAASDTTTIVVVETGNLRYGLVVDAPPDAEEIVVKPLGRHLKGRAEYAGATILGDGRVAMILDASGIAEAAGLPTTENSETTDTKTAVVTDDTEYADLVLFRNHPSETFAVPLGLVDRIQRVERKQLGDIGGRAVYAEGERVLPIVWLDRAMAALPGEDGERMSVLVLRLGKTQFGIVAPQVEDIRSLAIKIDDRVLSGNGVIGSFQLDDRTVRLLDVTSVAKNALPQLFVDVPVPPAAVADVPRGPIRVLFAEDTKFFREHVRKLLVDAGFVVSAAADGELAWQELQREGAQFDIVVTDVQMPNCDGLELTRRIRGSGPHKALPIVALTSLSAAEDQEEGRKAGVTAYLIKLDDAALVEAVRQYAGVGA